MPGHQIDVFELEEISCNDDVQDILMRDFIHHRTLRIIVLLLEEPDDELEGFKVASQCDLNTFLITDSINHGPEMLYVVQRPLLVQVDN